MVDKDRIISYNNKGSAIITALVVGTVLMVLTLSLLAISYQFFLTSKANTSDVNFRELFYSGIEVIEKELTDCEYPAPVLSDPTATPAPNRLGQDLVKAIDIDKSWAAGADNCKYYNLESLGSVIMIAKMYWLSTAKENDDQVITLHIDYTLYKNETGRNTDEMDILMKDERIYLLEETVSDTVVDGQATVQFIINHDVESPAVTTLNPNIGDAILITDVPDPGSGYVWVIHNGNGNHWRKFFDDEGTSEVLTGNADIFTVPEASLKHKSGNVYQLHPPTVLWCKNGRFSPPSDYAYTAHTFVYKWKRVGF